MTGTPKEFFHVVWAAQKFVNKFLHDEITLSDEAAAELAFVNQALLDLDKAHEKALCQPEPPLTPLTLDDVTRHTDALCAEYRQRMVDHQAWYTERVGQLSVAIEASEDLNHMEAGYIFLTKIRELTSGSEAA